MPHARTYGVFDAPSQDEIAVLAIADEFRAAFCAIQQERHERTIDARNAALPGLLPLLGEAQAIGFRVSRIEREIKALHSDVGDRNARTAEQEDELRALRERRAAAWDATKPLRAQWSNTLRAYSRWIAAQADWKNVKSLDRRRALYARLSPPPLADLRAAWDAAETAPTRDKHGNLKPRPADYVPAPFPVGINADAIAQYMAMDLELDLQERDLFALYQSRGLHSAIRGEIVAASQPKLTEDGEGMLYQYGRHPEPRPWEKIVISFPGGATVESILAGAVPGFRATEVGKNCWDVVQQIGTTRDPRRISYRVKLHVPPTRNAVIKSWTLCVRRERQASFSGRGFVERLKRFAIPVFAEPLDKPHGKDGVLSYRIGWTRRKAGIEVCRFAGTHVSESLILPEWLMAQRMGASAAQEECDLAANEALQERGAMPPANAKQGVDALAAWVAKHPEDALAGTLLDTLLLREHAATRNARRAARTIAKVYEMVVRRVCSSHAFITRPAMGLKKMKRYKTRDLLKDDVIPLASRKYMQAAAPGKLVALLKGWGLPIASGEAAQTGDDQETDVFTSEIAAIGRRSQNGAGTVAAK